MDDGGVLRRIMTHRHGVVIFITLGVKLFQVVH